MKKKNKTPKLKLLPKKEGQQCIPKEAIAHLKFCVSVWVPRGKERTLI